MNAFHAEAGPGRSRRGITALLLVCLMPLAAAAQSDGPIRLTPPPTNPFQVPEAAPDRGVGAQSPRPPERPAGSAAVEVQPLGQPPGEAIGVLEEGSGLGSDVWQGSDSAEIQRLLRDLPLSAPQRTLSALLQRLLLTRAPIQGDGVGQADLAHLRARVLVRLGNTEGAQRLSTAVDDAASDRTPSRARIEALLVENEREEACGAARRAVQSGVDAYAQRVLVFCQVAAGEADRAGIGLNVLREAGGSDDALFIALAETLLGFGSPPAQASESLTPLQFAMWQATGEPVPADLWRRSDPGIWRALAAAPDAPVADRVEAAELAVAAGALPGETLADLYRLVEGGAGERDRLAAEEPAVWSGRERALLFQNAAAAVAPAERAAALQRLFELARARGAYEAVVLASVPLTAGLDPTARLTFFAVHAGRAQLLAHDVTAAERWAALARREREVNPYAARDAAALGPLLALTGGGEDLRLSDDAFAVWWRQTLEADGATVPEKARLIVDLLEALGEPVPSSAGLLAGHESAGGGRSAASGPAGRMLSAAVSERARGKTILAVAHLLGDVSSDDGGRDALPLAVRALRLVGLEDDARRLAIEAALDAGI